MTEEDIREDQTTITVIIMVTMTTSDLSIVETRMTVELVAMALDLMVTPTMVVVERTLVQVTMVIVQVPLLLLIEGTRDTNEVEAAFSVEDTVRQGLVQDSILEVDLFLAILLLDPILTETVLLM